ncbi:phage major tail tube protein [Devosia sp. FJ2-5-3]|uniref:phage major tail tube protein n=1 Tax=Devosia sp. FJ2-5-3 TaxID=2976680 RepID=UPI0023D8BEA5|nr:phage major tail tube protein [Devosia sp. FJ2-5-3]WEJ60251.1 phage major tail tube protein [Devosia sp. FJ2-5-3]
MAAATINHIDAATIFVGDDDPTNSQHLVMKGVKLATLTERLRDFSPGGAPMGLQLGMRKLEALEMTFKLEGLNPSVRPKFMPLQRTVYTVRANVRDIARQVDLPFKAIVEGRMTQIEMGELGTDDGVESDYRISEIFYWQTFLNNQELEYFSALEGYPGVRINGVQVFRTVAANLGLV